MKIKVLVVCLLVACQQQQKQETTYQDDSRQQDSTYLEPSTPEQTWSYQELYGNYVLESSVNGFSTTLIIEPQGRDLAFTIVSFRGASCKGEVSSTIAMMNHNEFYYTGYSIEEACKLEFVFRHTEGKVDVKEIHICTLHDPACGFEGTYSKKNLN